VVDDGVAGSDVGVVGLGGCSGPDLVADAIAAVAHRDGTSTHGGRPVGSGTVEGGGMVDDHVTGLGGNVRQPVVLRVDRRDGFAFGVREWIGGHEPVGSVHGPGAM
jgi:hypothetical protein